MPLAAELHLGLELPRGGGVSVFSLFRSSRFKDNKEKEDSGTSFIGEEANVSCAWEMIHVASATHMVAAQVVVGIQLCLPMRQRIPFASACSHLWL